MYIHTIAGLVGAKPSTFYNIVNLNFFTQCTRFFFQDRDGYWKIMHKYVGADVTSLVTLPVLIFEPMSMLQKMAEVCVICTSFFYKYMCVSCIDILDFSADNGILIPIGSGR